MLMLIRFEWKKIRIRFVIFFLISTGRGEGKQPFPRFR